MSTRAINALVKIKDLNVAWRYINRPRSVDGLQRRLTQNQIVRLRNAIKIELDACASIINEEFPEQPPEAVAAAEHGTEAAPSVPDRGPSVAGGWRWVPDRGPSVAGGLRIRPLASEARAEAEIRDIEGSQE